jgi:hypothetical protein
MRSGHLAGPSARQKNPGGGCRFQAEAAVTARTASAVDRPGSVGSVVTRAVAVAAIAYLASVTASCGSHDCTDAGCRSGVTVEISRTQAALPKAHTVTVCIKDRCRRWTTESDLASIGQRSQDSAGPVAVRLVIRDRKGSVIGGFARKVSLTRLQPNGPDCPPVCWVASYRIEASGRIARTT